MANSLVGLAYSEGGGMYLFGGTSSEEEKSKIWRYKSRPDCGNKSRVTFVGFSARATHSPVQFHAFSHPSSQEPCEADSSNIILYVDEGIEV